MVSYYATSLFRKSMGEYHIANHNQVRYSSDPCNDALAIFKLNTKHFNKYLEENIIASINLTCILYGI